MSLITQCPACSTMFRVVPDQLRISEGWVRCGHCDEVFDANAHLGSLEEAGEATASAGNPSVDTSAHAPMPANELAADPNTAPIRHTADDYDLGAAWDNPMLVDPAALNSAVLHPDLMGTDPAEPHAAAPDPVEQSSPPGFEPDLERHLPPETHLAQEASTDMRGQEPVADLHLFEPAPAPNAEAHSFVDSAVPAMAELPAAAGPQSQSFAHTVVEPAVDSVSPSFMRPQGGKPAKPWLGNKLAAVLCSLLVIALVLQVALRERDRLAASAPALRPALVAGCELLACTVAPLRDIEAIAIDSSAFTSVRAGVYLLNVTLKNAAATELATPALELTLTDIQDQPLLRRVLLAADWSGKPSMAAGAERSASLPISVQADAVPQKIAGYKLLAFYP